MARIGIFVGFAIIGLALVLPLILPTYINNFKMFHGHIKNWWKDRVSVDQPYINPVKNTIF
jgi:hypothetical protein